MKPQQGLLRRLWPKKASQGLMLQLDDLDLDLVFLRESLVGFCSRFCRRSIDQVRFAVIRQLGHFVALSNLPPKKQHAT